MFEREDWTHFRTVEGLQQKAGVERGALISIKVCFFVLSSSSSQWGYSLGGAVGQLYNYSFSSFF